MKDVTAPNFNFSKFQNPGSSQSRMRTVLLTVKVSWSVIVTSLPRRSAAAAGTAASLEVNPDSRLQIILHQEWSLTNKPMTKSSLLSSLSIRLLIFQARKLVWGRFASQRGAVPSTRKSVRSNLKKKIWNRFFVKCRQNVRPKHLGFNVIKNMY